MSSRNARESLLAHTDATQMTKIEKILDINARIFGLVVLMRRQFSLHISDNIYNVIALHQTARATQCPTDFQQTVRLSFTQLKR